MRTKELLRRIGDKPPCLACDFGLGRLQQDGASDFVFLIRQAAEVIWSGNINEEKRVFLNDKFAKLIRLISGREEQVRDQISTLIKELDEEVEIQDRLNDIWAELRAVILEKYPSLANRSG